MKFNRRLTNFFHHKIKKNKGAALFIILTVFTLLIPLIQRVWLDSQSYYQLRRAFTDRMIARANAQAGMDLSLLRLHIFKGAEKSLSQELKAQFISVLDQTWLFPFEWPLRPTAELSEELLKSEMDSINKVNQLSFVKGGYSSFIQPEDGLLDLNNLASPIEILRDFTYLNLLNLLINEVEKKEELQEKYNETSLTKIVNNIADWIDIDEGRQEGGSEDTFESLALNRSLISLEELRKVSGLDEEIYQLLKPYVTLHEIGALNINYSKESILEAMGVPLDLVEQILLRIEPHSLQYQPFVGEEDFCEFNLSQGFDFCSILRENYESMDLLSFGSPIAFRINSIGYYRSQRVELTALLYDLDSSAKAYQKRLYLEELRLKKPEELKKIKEILASQKKGLKIDYSYQKSLVILYKKENYLDL